MPCVSPWLRETPDRNDWLPCGRCIGCLLDRRRSWAARLVHELHFHSVSSFLTLTYDDDHLFRPENNLNPSLLKRDLQLFLKRLRKKFSVRYFAVGEYGTSTFRPHYHLILYGCDFSVDRKPSQLRSKSVKTYKSGLLDSIWGNGDCIIGDVSPASCNYVAGYVTKKSLLSKYHYKSLGVTPEFSLMSRNPGIGALFVDKFASDLIPATFLVLKNGQKTSIPRYYLKRLQKFNLPKYLEYTNLLSERIPKPFSMERLLAKGQSLQGRINLSPRDSL